MFNYHLFIARRYLFSKKTTHAINIVSMVSVIGVAVATMSLVVTLSVFNGFRDTIEALFTQFDAQLKIVPLKGKTVAADEPTLAKLKAMDEVDVATEIVEDQALAVYGDKQAMVYIKGVDDNFPELTHIEDLLIGDGDFQLHAGNINYAIPGIGLAINLGLGARYHGFLRIFSPQREGQFDVMNPQDAFVEDSLMSAGVVFQVKQNRYDNNYIIVPISFARYLFDRQGEVSSLELRLRSDCNFDKTKTKIEKILDGKYRVLDRYEQQAETFQIMNIEKLLAYVFLTFILLVACFNIIGSLSMLMIDKKQDVKTIKSMGATNGDISKIFLIEGWLISFCGAIIGVGVGLLLCLLQETMGIVKLGETTGDFVVNAYPVSVHWQDIVIILATVVVVDFLSVWYPVKYMSKKLLSNNQQ